MNMIIVVITICLLLSSCSSEECLTVEALDFSSMEVVCHLGGTLVSTTTYEKLPQHAKKRFLQWAADSPFKGRTSFVTYAPNIVVRSTKFNVNFVDNRVVCNVISKTGKWKQVARKMNAGDKELRQVLVSLFQESANEVTGEGRAGE